MASKGRNSASDKAYYSSYNYEAQRRKRLERHLKRQPNDEQAQTALKNIHHRGPRPSNNKGGWMTRSMMIFDFYDDKKGPKLDNVSPKTLAWMRSIMKKAEKQHQHEKNYAPKAERKKGGNARK